MKDTATPGAPSGMKRYDMVTNYRCGESIDELERADDGEWVRYEDVEPILAALYALRGNRRSRDNDEPCDIVTCASCHAEIGWPAGDFTTPKCEECVIDAALAKAEGRLS